MFTGIIQDIGTVTKLLTGKEGIKLEVASKFIVDSGKHGDSVSINGICLTITKKTANGVELDILEETSQRTNLRSLAQGSRVNLELALTLQTFVGGHLVQGHIDGTGKIVSLNQQAKQWVLKVQADPDIISQLFPKASIAVNGISLTIVDVSRDTFSVHLIPTTYRDTMMQFAKPGDMLNIETDFLGKYVRHYLGMSNKIVPKSHLSKEYLNENGF